MVGRGEDYFAAAPYPNESFNALVKPVLGKTDGEVTRRWLTCHLIYC
jgi:hypothetical protein